MFTDTGAGVTTTSLPSSTSVSSQEALSPTKSQKKSLSPSSGKKAIKSGQERKVYLDAINQARILKLEVNNQTHLAYRKYEPPKTATASVLNASGATSGNPNSPQGVILVLHGISSHSGWYAQSCAMLAQKGFVVFAPDRRGSGLNRIERGHVQNWEDLISDIDAFVARIHAEYPQLPIFIVGISWGGRLALLYEALRPGDVKGVILVSPGIKPIIDLSEGSKMNVLWNYRKPLEKQPVIPIPLNKASYFTNSPYWQRWIEQDSLTLREATARFYWESSRMEDVLNHQIKKCVAPILLLLGSQDQIIDVQKTRKYFGKKFRKQLEANATAIPPVMVREYPNAAHTLEFEPNLSEIVSDMLRWLNRVVSSG
jgi:alpha-beta hydrolase superfamily lysophospholipase